MAEDDAPRPATVKRPTPWGVLVAAAVVFAIGLWLYLGVRDEVRQNQEERSRAKASAALRPKILGRDIIPQEAPAPPASQSASAAASAPPSGAKVASPAPSSSAVPE